MISMAENEKDIHHKAAAPTQEDSNERKPVSRSRSRGQQRRSQRSVFQYITVLFAAAFLLLLMTYMMQQRLNKAEIDDLQESSNSTLQTLDNIWGLFETAVKLNSADGRREMYALARELSECQNLTDWIIKSQTENEGAQVSMACTQN